MQDANIVRRFVDLSSHRTQILILILLVLITGAGYSIYVGQNLLANSPSGGAASISQTVLEEKYGLRLNLLAVTAAGGFVDVRLKIMESEKAKSLLGDPANFPSLSIGDVTLLVPQEAKERAIDFEKSGNLFIMFPNAASAVKKGTPVVLKFGDLALEPIMAK